MAQTVNFTAFYEALLNAKVLTSVAVLPASVKVAASCPKAVVQGNGNLLVGKAYTAMLDLQPGDDSRSNSPRKKAALVPMDAEDEESGED